MDTLYDRDLVEWAARNADLLRNHRFDEADIENIAEEIEDLGKSLRNSLGSHSTNLIAHLLKWQFQPQRRSRSWQRTIVNSRTEIEPILDQSPSLKAHLVDFLSKDYVAAVRLTAVEMGINPSVLPASCPYSIEQLLDYDYLP